MSILLGRAIRFAILILRNASDPCGIATLAQASFEELKIEQEKAVTLERLDEAIRGSEPIRDVKAQVRRS